MKKPIYIITSCSILLLLLFVGCNSSESGKEGFEEKTESLNTEFPVKGNIISKEFVVKEGDTLWRVQKYSDRHIVEIYDKYKGQLYLSEKSEYDSVTIKKNGPSEIYHLNGKLFAKLQFKQGLIWNIYEVYDSLGNKLNFGSIREGNGYVISYYPNGEKKHEGEIKDGMFQYGMIVYDTLNGMIPDTIVESNGFGADRLFFNSQFYVDGFHPDYD